MRRAPLFLLLILLQFTSFGQFKENLKEFTAAQSRFENIGEVINIKEDLPGTGNRLDQSNFVFESIERNSLEIQNIPNLQAVWSEERDIPLAIHGKIKLDLPIDTDINERTLSYLEQVKAYLGIEEIRNRFSIHSIQTDVKGKTHVRVKQNYMGIPIYGGEIIIHFDENNDPYFMNGFWYPEKPAERDDQLQLRSNYNLKEIVQNDLGSVTTFRNMTRFEKNLLESDQWIIEKVYYNNKDRNTLELTWKVTVHPNIADEWVYFINDATGNIETKYQQICKLDHGLVGGHDHDEKSKSTLGGETALATDLLGNTQEINVYSHGGSYYLIDASRDMYNANQSNMPNDPIGVIWTLDAQNTSPENNSFNVEQLSSSNNNWNDKIAVSAHYNAQTAYDYYKNKFGRNAINGTGGNIISIINVVDGNGSQMDNAFWSGKAMFYGNGKDAFAPLAGALDVAGHEMTHGVIQSTANLEYYGEPGAINESFADVFGCMIDRDDWKLGEDVVYTNVFTSGALRDMSNPHNGGSSLNDNGYQPAHVNEQYQGTADNAGVHINSGIPNYAFYKFAQAVTKTKAEKIYYKALTSYLTKSSRFMDLRVAVEQAAFDLYGETEKTAASNAFEAVGIKGGGTSTGGENYQNDLQVNQGDDLIVFNYEDGVSSNLVLAAANGTILANPLSNTEVLSKPSVSDNGSEIVFVGQDRKIHYIYLDWEAGQFEESVIQDEPIWRNVIISKDGWRIAALTEELDNRIHIYDFGLKQWNAFEIYNPSTVEGATGGGVDFIDAMEFNYSGEWIMYDAQNTIQSQFGSIEFWDIGFVQVFNNGTTNWGEGLVQKLFSGLPENTSIGNPTFSKNSPYIIAFDYLVGSNEYYIVGSNLETGAVSQMFENLSLGYPNYSRQDKQLIFDYNSFFGTDLAILGVGDDKISYVPNSDKILFEGASWGVWFSNMNRSLVLDDGYKLKNISEDVVLSPNPNTGLFNIKGKDLKGEYYYQIMDLYGKSISVGNLHFNGAEKRIDLSNNALIPGIYFISLKNKEQIITKKFLIKQ